MTQNNLILKGKPREKGNSVPLNDLVRVGAERAGTEVESEYLHGLDISPCEGCFYCEVNGFCVVDDDVQSLSPKPRGAYTIIITSPIYCFTYSTQVKLSVNRWLALATKDGNELRGKQIDIVLT